MQRLQDTPEWRKLQDALAAHRRALEEAYGENWREIVLEQEKDPDICDYCHMPRGAGLIGTARPSPENNWQAQTADCPRCTAPARQATRLARYLGESGIPVEHQNIVYETAHPADFQQVAFEALRAYVEKPDRWILLHGPPYGGKTWLAYLIGNESMKRGTPVVFREAPALLRTLRSTFSEDHEATLQQMITTIQDVPLLILDDFGREHQTPWASEQLFDILSCRWERKRPTVLTTNLAIPDLMARNERLTVRLQDRSQSTIFSIHGRYMPALSSDSI